MLDVVHGVIRKLLGLPQVTVAAVHGACLGGGCEVASVCDFIVATEESFFRNAGNSCRLLSAGGVGAVRGADRLPPGGGNDTHRPAFQCPRGPGDGIDQSGVCRWRTGKWLAESGRRAYWSKSGAVMRLTVKGLRELSLRDFDAALKRSEQIYCDELLSTADVEEGVQAFLQKRPPQWRHR